MDKYWGQSEENVIKRFREAVTDRFPAQRKEIVWERLLRSIWQARARRVSGIRRWAAVAGIVLLTGGIYLWQTLSLPEKQEYKTEWLTLTTNNEERLQVTLPDSSSVWLNANSRLTYPKAFMPQQREVVLSGEAFFDIRPEKKAFLVRTERLHVSVPGTRFMVSDYRNTETVEAILLSGSVKVATTGEPHKATTLKPNQQWRLSAGDMQAQIHDIDAVSRAQWVTGQIIFEDASLKDIAERLGSWYGIKIDVEKGIETMYRLTFVIRNETWTQARSVIQMILPEVAFAESDDKTKIIRASQKK
ncbi:MAG: FecR domain-containing protein [Dysgonamonadaceae bacterium]|jgi:ferric-dicitrate binding protein FerR (iron transport regulator)|nr:FecR domain-containing protein [Dysgonamonadaceae bacterium]